MIDESPLCLLVEDEAKMRRLLRPALTAHGLRLLEAGTFADGLRVLRDESPQLILLDLGLPDGDGVDFTRRVRAWSRVPIIVISARVRDRDKVEALDAGADDYVTKPFSVTELLARIRVAFRHAHLHALPPAVVYNFGDLKLDLDRREVTLAGREIHLTPIEYKLLVMLAENAGRVLTHRQILERVWGETDVAMTHYVCVRVGELRKKIEPDPHRPKLLVTAPGVGYKLRDVPGVTDAGKRTDGNPHTP